ncbi:hypothetical protein MRX96_052813, partial [Rhipicephalus microplus]
CNAPPPLRGSISTSNCRADVNHLCWECPVYKPPRLRALATVKRRSVSFFSPDLRLSGAFAPRFCANELWPAFILFLQEPVTPPLGYMLRDSPTRSKPFERPPLSCLHDVHS